MRFFPVLLAVPAFLLSSCFGGGSAPSDAANAPSSEPPRERRILAMGDSLTAGYQLPPESAYPAQLESLLRSEGYAYRVENAGVSGDVSSGLLSRTDWLLSDPVTDLAILCIGANDGLQGLSVSEMESNLLAIVRKLKEKNVKTVLVGMKMPTNLGPDYVREFESVYPRVAKSEGLPFLPFLLDGVARDPKLNLSDGIHPNAQGYAVVAKRVFEFLEREGLITE